jgi:tRNA (adenine57-N1/adenine58-N1)-methyltransferase
VGIAQEDDWVVLVSPDHKRYTIRLSSEATFHTHKGHIQHSDIIGLPLGREITSHLGSPFLVLRPSLHDQIMNVRRASAIVYPKEIGLILLKMSIGPGCRVIEAGCGSGALTTALASMVRPTGRVHSYDSRDDMCKLTARNLAAMGLSEYVEIKCRDIALGFEQQNVNAVFLDVREPWDYLEQVREAIEPGGFFGALVPTVNQISRLLAALAEEGFADTEVCELLLRPYKPVSGRLRPFDRMIAHTGYLIFSRPLVQPGAQAATDQRFVEKIDQE